MRMNTVGHYVLANAPQALGVIAIAFEPRITLSVTEGTNKALIDLGIDSLKSLIHCINNVAPILFEGIRAKIEQFPFSVIATLMYPCLKGAH